MDKKTYIFLILLLYVPEKKLLAGTGSASDGFLSFILLLGFLLLLLGIIHLVELTKVSIRRFLDGIDIADLFGL